MKTTRRSALMWMAAASFAIALIAAPPAHAFGFSGVGGKLGYSNPENLDGTAEMGVHAELEKPGARVHLLPNVMYWNVNRVRDLSPNMDVYYHFSPEGTVSPYLGGGVGLNFVHRARTDAGETDLGMNVVGGLKFPGSSNHYFLEGRFTASDINQVSLLTGITFHSSK